MSPTSVVQSIVGICVVVSVVEAPTVHSVEGDLLLLGYIDNANCEDEP